jgi:DNA polymerase-3 subunit epsilon
VRSSRLGRRLVVGVLLLVLVPTILAGAILYILYRRGALTDPAALGLAAGVGFVTSMIYLGVVTHSLGRVLVRTLQEIQLGTELMATVNPAYRLQIRTGDELQALAEEINRMADRVLEARSGLEGEVERTTQQLLVERSKLSAVLETLGEGVVVATVEGRILLANGAAQERLGAGSTGLLGRSLFDFVDREKIAHFMGRLRASGGATERFSLHPAGGAVLGTVMTPFFDADRALVGFVLVLRDVTSPVRSEQARHRLLEDTGRDLRGALSSIRSLSESLLGEGVSRDETSKLLEAIHAESVRLSRLLREFGAPTSFGAVPGPFERMSIADLKTMVLSRLGPLAPGIVEVDDDASGLPPLRAETSALSVALAHMLRTVLDRRAAGRPAWLRAAQRGGLIQLDVGAPGRAALADLDQLLDRPVTVGSAGTEPVREIVRAHAGEVWSYLEEGRFGFRVTLPAPALEPAVAPAARFVGAGMVSAFGAGEPSPPRPDFYDFSLLEEMDRHVRRDDRERPLAALDYVVLDVETTGLEPARGDRIVSLAAVKVRGGTVRRGETFDALVDPQRPIPSESVRFHGITDARVAGAPTIDVVLPEFFRFAEDAVLVGHQVWFDLSFLGKEAARLGLPPLTEVHPVLDTLLLSELVHGPLEGHGLDTVAARFGVAVQGRHSALGDAVTTAEIFARLLELLKKRGVVTLGRAIEASRRALRAPSDGEGTAR